MMDLGHSLLLTDSSSYCMSTNTFVLLEKGLDNIMRIETSNGGTPVLSISLSVRTNDRK